MVALDVAAVAEPHAPAAHAAKISPHAPGEEERRVLVVGGGPCGVRAAQSLARLGCAVTLFNAEAFEPYNRVKLTPLLAGDVQLGDIALPPVFDGPAGRVETFTGLRVTRVDREARRVETADGQIWSYAALVLATGSTPFVPNIPGRERSGVYTFRDAEDVSALVARSFTARRVVVIGGGLLGLEAARGMLRRGAEVVVVEHEDRLMPRQLDDAGAAILRDRIEGLGVAVTLGARVAEIEGADRVSGVRLSSGARVACDTVIICTGVRANAVLAKEAGLSVGRGVLVDDQMRSSDPAIFAVGECAEHRGVVHGLVGPGLEQADVAADVIALLGEDVAPPRYAGSAPATKLKVIGAEVFSAGAVEDLELRPNVRAYSFEDGDSYRRIFVERGALKGAVAVGEWREASRLQQAVSEDAPIGWLNLMRFRRSGNLWPEPSGGAAAMPAGAIVCNCTGTTCGRIRDAATLGAGSLAEIKAATGASTVCGSCGPLIEELISGPGAPIEPVRLWRPLLWLSTIGALAALVTMLAPSIPLPDAYRGAPLLEKLWFDNVWKQWSGYTLLGLSVAALGVGLRKRVLPVRWLGGYDWWRLTHLVIGALTLIVLFAHTGFRFGANLTFALMLCFVATLVFGAVAGLATAGEHKLRAQGVGAADKPPRTVPIWLHVLAIWPLPVLLAAHILSIYVY